MPLGETLASLVGIAPARTAGLKVWETPEVDLEFPAAASVVLRRESAYLDGINAIQQSTQRARATRGGSVLAEATVSGDAVDLTQRLSKGLSAQQRIQRQGRRVSRGAIESYAAYESLDRSVQEKERSLHQAVATHLDSLSSQSPLAPEWERYRHDVAAVLHAGKGLEADYAQEHRLLGIIGGGRGDVRAYQAEKRSKRQVPSELFATKRLFSTEETEMTVSDLWFLNNGVVDTNDPNWQQTITNFMHRAGVIQLPRIAVLAKNAWAQIFGGEINPDTVMRVALPFMPVRQLMQARAAIAVANGVLTREYGSETADSYTVYRALSQRQIALDKEAAILEDFTSADEHKITLQPVRNAYMRHISKPLVNRLAAVTARFSL